MQNRKSALLFTGILWGTVLALSPMAWATTSKFQRGTRLGWLLLMPLLVLSVLLFLSSLLEFWRESATGELSMSSERHQRSEHLLRIAQTCLHLLPLAGVCSLALMLGLQQTEAGLLLPTQLALLSLLSLGLLLLLRPSSHWVWFVGLGLLTLLWMGLTGPFDASNPMTQKLSQNWMQKSLQRFPRLVMLAGLFVLYVGLCIRWWKRARNFRPWLQTSALLFVLLSLVGTLAGLKTTSKQWISNVSWLLFFVAGLELTRQIPQALETAWCLWRRDEEHSLDFSLLLLGTFPLAYLVALASWLYVGGKSFGSPLQRSPTVLLLLLGAHVLSAMSVSMLAALHNTDLKQENRLWMMFKAAILYALVFVPFGFGALVLFRGLW